MMSPRPAKIEHFDRQFVFVLEFKRKASVFQKCRTNSVTSLDPIAVKDF